MNFLLLSVLLFSAASSARPSSFASIWPRSDLASAAPIVPDPSNGHWVDTWTTMPQLTEPANLPNPPFNGTGVVFPNTTIRQTLKISTGAQQIRLRFSNAFGTTPLPITAATLALPVAFAGRNLTGSSGINITTTQPVTFSGNSSITVPPGALAVSDPISFPVQPGQILSISMYLSSGQLGYSITSHPGSRTTSYLSFGDFTSASNLTDPSTQVLAHWYFLTAVEAWQPEWFSTLAVLGDSLTDGRGSDVNGNSRWTDSLFRRLQSGYTNPLLRQIGIANQAAGGNRVLADGLGPSVLSRVERDVLAQSGIKYAMAFEGVNDIGVASPDTTNQTIIYNRLIQAYQQIVSRIHAHGIPVFGATITPFGCTNTTIQPYSNPEREKTRLKINSWIRSTAGKVGGFDGLVDFDAVVRDPKNVTQLKEQYNLGDCLHLNPIGYQALADGFPLDLFEKFRDGVSGFA